MRLDCVFGTAFVRLRFPLFIYLLRSVFYVRFYLSVGLVHGTHYLFDSKIFTKMCLLVGPQRMRFASFFYFWCCVCAFTFSLFLKKKIYLKFIYWEVCFTWDSVCQWVLCTGPTASLIVKFSLECVCQWAPNVCVLRPFLFLVLCLCVYVYVFHFFFF